MAQWNEVHFDRWQWAGKRPRAVSKDTGISFQDFGRMHVGRREVVQERRLPTPRWSILDTWLRELLVVYLEERFYITAIESDPLVTRLDRARRAADLYAPRKRQLLDDWLQDYHVMSTKGYADLNDEQVVDVFVSLKHINGQLPINADVARDYLTNKKLHDLEIQIQNMDTDLVLTAKGHAEIIAAIVYFFYRVGWDSVTVAEALGLKPPHVRQVLARLHATWDASLAWKFAPTKKIVSGTQDAAANPQGVEVSDKGDTVPEPTPLEALFMELS